MADKGFLMQLLGGAVVGLKGAAKAALPFFDGEKWGVREAGSSGQVLTVGETGDIEWKTPSGGSVGPNLTVQTLTLDKPAIPKIVLRENGVAGSGWEINADSGYLNFLEAEDPAKVVFGFQPGVTGEFVATKRTLIMGNGAASDLLIQFNNGAADWPIIRYNNSLSRWEATDDGVNYYPMNGPNPTLQTTGTAAIYSLPSAVSSTVTALADVAAWSFNVTAGKSYRIEIIATYQTGVTTTGGKLAVYLPSGAGTILGFLEGAISSAAVATELKIPIRAIGTSNLAGSWLLTTGVSTINQAQYIGGTIVFHCTTSGVFRCQWASEVASSAAQLNAGSTMIVQLLN